MNRRICVFVFLSLLSLTACSQEEKSLQEPSKQQDSQLYSQSLPNEENQDKTENRGAAEEVEKVEVVFPPGYGVPHIEPSKQAEYEKQLGPKISQTEPMLNRLTLTEFKDRWNMLAADPNWKLSTLEQINLTNQPTFYRRSINNEMEIRVFVSDDHKVQKVQVKNNAQSPEQLMAMLSVWSQMVYLFNTDSTPHHIDELFDSIGIGPNLDFTEVKEKIVVMEGVYYQVVPLEAGYQFEVAYSKDEL